MAIAAKWEGRERVMRKLRAVVPEAEKELAAAQAAAAGNLAQAIRARAPRGLTGEYVASIEADRLANRPGQKPVGMQTTKDPHAQGIFALYIWRFLEFGSRAHAIAPKKARGLFFRGKRGESVFVGAVQHPGMAARPHIFPTYRAMRKRIRRQIAAALRRSVKKAKG